MVKSSELMLLTVSIIVNVLKSEVEIACSKIIDKIPGYECESAKPIGSGKESLAYIVKDKETKTNRVMKVSRTEASIVDEDPEIFYLKTLQKVPQVIRFYPPANISVIEGNKYLIEVLEYAKYGDLENFIKNYPTYFTNDETLIKFSLELVAGLKGIHSNNVIHASIKHQNIAVMEDYSPKYIDFNWSVPSGVMNLGRGDHLFNAPEVLINRYSKINWEPSKDIYSLGIVFYYMIHSDLPFNGLNRYLFRRSVERKRYYVKSGIRDDYLKIIQKCLKWNPAKRAKLDELEEMLNKALSEKSPSKLQKDQIANLDDDSLEDTNLFEIDPLLIIIALGCLIISLIVFIFIYSIAKKKTPNVGTSRTELVTNENVL